MQRYSGALILSILLTMVGYGFAVLWSGYAETWQAVSNLGLGMSLLVLLLSMINYVIRYARWEIYLSSLDTPVIPRRQHFLIYLAGFALTTTPGKAGEAIRSYYLKPYGVGYGQSLSVLFVERLMDLLAVILIALLSTRYFEDPAYFTAACLSGLVVLAILPLVHNRPLWTWLAAKANSFSSKLGNPVNKLVGMINDSAVLLKNRLLYGGLVLAIIAWGLEGYGFYLVLDALGLEINPLVAVGIYSIAVLIGAMSFFPGGLGGTEVVMGLLLIAVGADNTTAVAATLICRLATLWFAVVLGMGALAIVARSDIQKGLAAR
jgi:glycosyltransferase 2 family protein